MALAGQGGLSCLFSLIWKFRRNLSPTNVFFPFWFSGKVWPSYWQSCAIGIIGLFDFLGVIFTFVDNNRRVLYLDNDGRGRKMRIGLIYY